MKKDLPKTYDPKLVESAIYDMWMENDCFKAEPDPDKKPYSIVMPPPNVTGQLHMGHALDSTLQDILTRYKRMEGYSALWLPGTDHAGIATQIKVEEELRVKEGKTRYDLGREKFLERVWAWKEKYGSRIVEQQRKLGVSCDWSRSRFTMDEGCSRAVREAFCEMYDKGLIYKGSRIINWCPHCLTALSDAEVEYVDKPGHLWYIRYPLSDGSGDIVVATTRPETMMGDTGVAVNPNDEKFQHLIGKTCILPIMNREIPIVGDEYCEIGFGTGAVKMTPAHDPNDFEVGLRHNLDVIRVIADNGTINENGGKYNGMDRYECRKALVKDLEEQGYLVKTEPYSHNVGTCYRCHNDVEPLISAQWFVKMKPLAEEAIRVVKDGTIKFVPERFSKTYLNWMENVHDWCISRQRNWGVPLPFFMHKETGELHPRTLEIMEEVAKMVEEKGIESWATAKPEDFLTADEAADYVRSTDILDVWFDSGVTHYTVMRGSHADELAWPADLYLEGSDQHRGWFHSSLLTGTMIDGRAPYKMLLTHGFVVDEKGEKMSKSKGNVVRPQEVSEKFGAEILRLWVASTDYSGELRLGQTILKRVVESYRRVRNTLRFLLANTSDFDASKDLVPVENLLELDRWALAYTERFQKEVLAEYGEFRFHNVVSMLQTFASADLGSFYLDVLKDRLYTTAPGSEARRSAQTALWYITKTLLRLMAPVLSFTAEEAFKVFSPNESETIFTERFEPLPEVAGAEALLAKWDAVRTVRADLQKKIEELRGEGQIGSSLQAVVRIEAAPAVYDALASLGDELRFVMIVSAVELVKSADEETHFAVSASKEGKCERCWHYVAGIGSDAEHPTLCPRCASNLFGAGEKRLFA